MIKMIVPKYSVPVISPIQPINTQEYDRKESVPYEELKEILEGLDEEQRLEVNGTLVKNSSRLVNIHNNIGKLPSELKPFCYGIERTSQKNGGSGYHINIYGMRKDGRVEIITQDTIKKDWYKMREIRVDLRDNLSKYLYQAVSVVKPTLPQFNIRMPEEKKERYLEPVWDIIVDKMVSKYGREHYVFFYEKLNVPKVRNKIYNLLLKKSV